MVTLAADRIQVDVGLDAPPRAPATAALAVIGFLSAGVPGRVSHRRLGRSGPRHGSGILRRIYVTLLRFDPTMVPIRPRHDVGRRGTGGRRAAGVPG